MISFVEMPTRIVQLELGLLFFSSKLVSMVNFDQHLGSREEFIQPNKGPVFSTGELLALLHFGLRHVVTI